MKKSKKITRLLRRAPLSMLAVPLLALPAAAAEDETSAGDVASVVEDIWENLAGQIKRVTNNVVLPAFAMASAIVFVVALVITIWNYNKRHTVEIGWPIAAIIALIVCAGASTWIWTLAGA